MIKKIILLAALCLCTTGIFAQVKNPCEKYDFGLELGYGYDSSLNGVFRGQWHLNKYITWDMLQWRWAQDLNNAYDSHKFSMTNALTTGLRVYTPTFGPGMKLFASTGAGWGHYCTWDKPEKKWSWKGPEKYNKTNNLAADFGGGLFWQCFYISYNYQHLHNNSRGNYGNHFINIGIEFGSIPTKWLED